MLNLAFGLKFSELYQRDGLLRLDNVFVDALEAADRALGQRLREARAAPSALAPLQESELLIALAPRVEDFIAELFGIATEVQELAARHHELAPLYSCKRLFVQRKAMHQHRSDAAAGFDGAALRGELARHFGGEFSELAFARHVTRWQQDETAHAAELDAALRYAAWAAQTPEGAAFHAAGVLFKTPHKLDSHHLVALATDTAAGYTVHSAPAGHLHRRDGFKLSDPGADLTGALDQANYCIWCHERDKDSCSKGLREKGATGYGAASFKKSAFGVTLAGCPLEEKISEFHKVKSEGLAIAALAMIMVDNPMVAATGHRICNDCMKACIYQKQTPVDIPQAETRTLKDVLELPWGFEIHSLLTRWNPLNLHRPVPLPASGRRVLVVGMGPAGFTLAHHLMNDGHLVAGIDGLKIEPLPPQLSGVDSHGQRVAFAPIRDIAEIQEPLESRVMAGFGGVAEYGITARWNKNFLKIIRLLLERRAQFALFGGVFFGGTLRLEDACALGFDHVALAVGAGKPTLLDLPNGLARGVRAASDFLMALQLTGAAKTDSISSIQLRLPVVVIGGGLTATDTATESLAYYPVQVEKFLQRYEILIHESGEAAARLGWNAEERAIADEFLGHARAIRRERASAAREGREARVLELLQSWGGVTVAYRRRLIDSPAYTLNHEEVGKALEEGVRFAEGLSPLAIETDGWGHVRAIRLTRQHRDADGKWVAVGEVELPAKSILIAAGTRPNTMLAREDPENFALDGAHFGVCDEAGNTVRPENAIAKPEAVRVLLASHRGRYISHFGDAHPSYFGNVVRAMASAKQGYPVISRVLARNPPASPCRDGEFVAVLNRELRATVHEVQRLTPQIVEVVVRAPLAARRFRPGQFYRFQNYEAIAARAAGTVLAMEGLALSGAEVDPQRGLVSMVVRETGGSSEVCRLLKPGEPVVLMGPTGSPSEIPAGRTALLVGGGIGNAMLLSIGQALRRAGSRVLYVAGYRRMIGRCKSAEIEAAADFVVWCCDEAPGFVPGRPQDKSFLGDIVQGLQAYADGSLGEQPIALAAADHVIVAGSERMMGAVARARDGALKPYLKPHHLAIASLNSPMQCMMKEICARCLQPQRDAATGKVRYVYSCCHQEQPLAHVDFDALGERLRLNSTQEKLTALWIRRCLHEIAAGDGR